MKNALPSTWVVVLVMFLLTGLAGVAKAQERSSAGSMVPLASLRDSIGILRLEIDSLKAQAPGLGDYMTAIQLHIAKLWYGFTALNWELVSYELNEMKEAIEGAMALHAVKNNVNTAGVLQSVEQTQVASMEKAVASKDHRLFSAAYHETLEACNSCHRSAGYGFISVTLPSAPPVTNQVWDAH